MRHMIFKVRATITDDEYNMISNEILEKIDKNVDLNHTQNISISLDYVCSRRPGETPAIKHHSGTWIVTKTEVISDFDIVAYDAELENE